MTDRFEPVDPLRLRLAANAPFSLETAHDHPLDQPAGRLAHDHGARFAQFLQSAGQVYRVAESRGAAVVGRFDMADDGRSGVDADPKAWPQSVARLDGLSLLGDPLLDGERGATGPQRRVLQGVRHAEQRHNAVAGEGLHRATVLFDRRPKQLRHALHQPVRGFLAGAFGKCGKTGQVGEQNRHLAAFAGKPEFQTRRSSPDIAAVCPWSLVSHRLLASWRLIATKRLCQMTPVRRKTVAAFRKARAPLQGRR